MAMREYDVGDVVSIRVTFTTGRTLGTIIRGSNQLELEDAAGYTAGVAIVVEGAGYGGGDLYTSVNSAAGTLITLSTTALSSVNRTPVGRLADPSPVKFHRLTPAKVKTTLVYGTDAAVVRESLGRFLTDLELTEGGMWLYKWEGAGAVKAVVPGQLYAKPAGV